MSRNNKTKELIFETAIDLLNEKSSLVLKDISAKANVNIAAINYYFIDKDHLIEEIIKKQILDTKNKVFEYISNPGFDIRTRKETLKKILSFLYNYSIQNLGLLSFIFNPANKKVSELSIYTFMHNVTLDNNFLDKMMSFLKSICTFRSVEEFRLKYTHLISGFCFPLVVELDFSGVQLTSFNSIKNIEFRNKYIEELCETLYMDIKY